MASTSTNTRYPFAAWGDPDKRTDGWISGQQGNDPYLTPGGDSGEGANQFGGLGGQYSYNFNPDDLKALGYTGDPSSVYSYGPETGVGADALGSGSPTGWSPDFQKFLDDNQIQSRLQQGEAGGQQGFFGADGKQIGTGSSWGPGVDDTFGGAIALASLLSGGEAAGLGAGGAAGSAALDGGADAAEVGLGGSGGGSIASDPLGAYLNTGASDFSTVGGSGGYAGAVGANAAPEMLTSAVPGASTLAPDSASTGSDAHFYNNPTASEGGLGNMTGAPYTLPSGLAPATSGASSAPTLSQLLNPAAKVGSALSGSGIGVGTALAGAGAAAVNASNAGSIGIPNYSGAANSAAQSARTNQTTPWGSSTWQQTGTDAQGNPIWSQNTTLNAQGTQNLNSAQQAQGQAIGALGQDQSSQIQQAQNAAYQKQTAMLDPQYAQGQEQLTSQLANQGIGIGSEAYNNATDNFARQKDYAYGNARDSAIGIGDQMQGQLFGQNLSAATGLNSAVTSPSFGTTPTATNYLGAAALQGQGNLNQYNATTGANNSFTNGLFNLGGSVLSNPNWTGLLGNLFSNGGQTPSTSTTQGP